MNKKEYIAPTIKITVCELQDSFLAGSDKQQWGPNNDLDGIHKEGDGELPDEITGSKEHNGWSAVGMTAGIKAEYCYMKI